MTFDAARSRRTLLATIALVATFAALFLTLPARSSAAPPACTSGPQPPRDINTYMLFAYTDLYVKGGTASVPGRGLFTGGNLGSNGFATVGDANATLGTNYGVYLSDGNAVVADHTDLGPGHPLLPTSVWDLFTNEITNNDFDPASVRNSGPTCFGPPIIDTGLPSFVAFTHPSGPYQPTLPSFPSAATLGLLPDTNVPNNGSLNLVPGDYGDIDLNDGATLNLSSGIYNLHSLRSGKNVTINTVSGTEVRIAVDFRSNDNITIQGSDLARFYIRSDGLGPSDFSFTLGFNTKPNCPTTVSVHGQFFIPNGRINLGDCTNIFGRVWADVIRNDTNINVTFRADGAVGGIKYFDQDADGQIDAGEPGLAGFTFYVDYNDNGELDPDEPSGVSDATGHYTISPVEPGNWTIREVGQDGYVCSFPSPCSYDVVVSGGGLQGGNDFANELDAPNHFQCYEIHRSPINQAGFPLNDALGQSTVTVKQAKRLCLPANKNGEDPSASNDPGHLTYYTIVNATGVKSLKGVSVDNQFGPAVMKITKPDRMLVPTAKSLTGPPAALTDPLDSYKCYKVGGTKFSRQNITIVDQFGMVVVDVKKPAHLCLPASANGSQIVRPNSALMCYLVRSAAAPARPAQVWTQNMFGPDNYSTFGARDLCVPSDVILP